jgi:hypothetical protein
MGARIYVGFALACAVTGCSVDDRQLLEAAQALGPDAGDSGGAPIAESGAGGASETGGGGGAPVTDAASDAPPTEPWNDGGHCVHFDLKGEPDCDDTIVTNADFDFDAEKWEADLYVLADWLADDTQASPTSGSIRVRNTRKGNFDDFIPQGVSQCVPVTEGLRYTFSAETFIKPGQAVGYAEIAAWFYREPECAGNPGELYGVAASTSTNQWVITTGTGLIAPAGAKSMRVRLNAKKPWREVSFEVQFDAVRVKAN